jgi:NAD(P)-dependent dehydrogenase (short-subunit alcohol dehydrogenase family)
MVPSDSRFQDKVAVVTGGNSGIGLATARALTAEGARVFVSGRDAATLEAARAELGPQAVALQADVSTLAGVERLVQAVREQAGRIDVLFVNAGIARFAPLEQVDEELFDATFATNVKGAFFTVQRALPLLSQGASVVLNASAVVEMGMPGSSVYTASKAAVASLARTLSGELAQRGVRFNVVHPGPIETPIYGRMGMDAQATEAMAGQILSQVPLGRFGQPEEIAQLVLFLSSDAASFVHGASVLADGGMSRA